MISYDSLVRYHNCMVPPKYHKTADLDIPA